MDKNLTKELIKVKSSIMIKKTEIIIELIKKLIIIESSIIYKRVKIILKVIFLNKNFLDLKVVSITIVISNKTKYNY